MGSSKIVSTIHHPSYFLSPAVSLVVVISHSGEEAFISFNTR